MTMLRRFLGAVATVVVVATLLFTETSTAQVEDSENEDEAVEATYGDAALIEVLDRYNLLDDWIIASQVSPQASLLLVNGADYQARQGAFLDSIEAWANRTEAVRAIVSRIEGDQDYADRLRAILTQVRDALVLDDRLAVESKTAQEIADALTQLETIQIVEPAPSEVEDPLIDAEIRLIELLGLVDTELNVLLGQSPADGPAGIDAFLGYNELLAGLDEVDLLIDRRRQLIRTARESSERLEASLLEQLPSLHATRMTQPTDVEGLTVVTVDAYVRSASTSTCSVDWALLAGIGKIESNHGRIGGATVSPGGQVSTTILGPLLDGETVANPDETPEPSPPVYGGFEVARLIAETLANSSVWNLLRGSGGAPTEQGNGFATVVDTDDGVLDGNADWDRAIGPMQFLPETWSRWATDGNGDGVADPHNLYDAATSATRFLCHLSETRGSSPTRFLLGYNASTSYVRSVIATAESLRSASLPGG